MATVEQCTERLRKLFHTKEDVIAISDDWGGGHASNTAWDEEMFIQENVKRIVDQARRKGLLDALGMKLGFPSEGEQNRRNIVSANRQSRIAIVISGAALLVSILVAVFK